MRLRNHWATRRPQLASKVASFTRPSARMLMCSCRFRPTRMWIWWNWCHIICSFLKMHSFCVRLHQLCWPMSSDVSAPVRGRLYIDIIVVYQRTIMEYLDLSTQRIPLTTWNWTRYMIGCIRLSSNSLWAQCKTIAEKAIAHAHFKFLASGDLWQFAVENHMFISCLIRKSSIKTI